MFLLGESQGRGSLVGGSLWGCTESDTTEVTQQQQQQVFTATCGLSLVAASRGSSLAAVHELLAAGALLAAEHSSGHAGLSSCGTQA